MPPSPVRAGPLRLAAALLMAEALAAGGFGVLVLSQVIGPRPGLAVGAGLLLVAYGVALLGLARGVLRARRWARGPAVASQLLHLLTAWSFRTGSPAAVAGSVAVAAAVVLVCLLVPTSTAAFGPTPSDKGG